MIKRFSSALARFCALSTFVLLHLALTVPLFNAQASAQSSGPRIWLQESTPLAVNYTGSGAQAGIASPQPVAMVQGDFDHDGIADLVVGYSTPNGGAIAVYRGNLDAFAPQSDASFQAIGRGEFPSPFLPDAQIISVPVSPAFLATGDFTGQGHVDLAFAAKGGSTLYVFNGDGKGGFTPGATINLPGGVTALAADQFGSMHLAMIVGVSNGKQSFLAVYGVGAQGLTPVAAVPVSAPATNILFGNLGDPGPDAGFLSGGQVQILRSSNMKTVTVSLPVSGVAFALGSFLWDRNGGAQIAVLGADGTVHLAVRNEFDPRVYSVGEFQATRQATLNHQPSPSFVPAPSFPANGWKIAESFPALSTVAAGQSPVFFRTRISSNGADDVMWLGAASGQMVLISHPDGQPGAQNFLPGQVSVKPYKGSPVVALPIRTNIDGRPGIVALHQGQIGPSASMPLPDPTFFPNRFDDIAPRGTAVTCLNTIAVDGSGDCTLREAVIKANATAGADTIMLQAGTYTLTRGRIASPLYDANTGTLNINDSLTITGQVDGSGNPASIITWTAGPLTNGTSVDMIFAVNEDLPAPTAANGTFSNLIIENGVNHGTHLATDNDGGCMEFDTGTNGTANLSLTNVIIQNCATTQGAGGGLVTFDFVVRPGTGTVTISNSTFQNNSAVDSAAGTEGGGIAISAGTLATISNTTVKNNTSNHVVGSQAGLGGGIGLDATGAGTGFGTTTIHNSTISGNKAGAQGGGISDLGTGLTVDQGTVISGNQAGLANAGNARDGGGVYLSLFNNGCPASCVNPVSFSKVTIINNSAAGNGGGIFTGSGGTFPTAGPMSIAFSRLAGNTAGGSGSNLANSGTTVTATNNWWGTNAAGSTINTTIAGATTTFDPFIVLTHTASPNKIRINQSSTLTADMSKDNHGNGAALAGNLNEIVGLPITFNNSMLGTIPQSQPENLGNPTPTATATYNAGGAGGNGSADATVDQQTVTANIIVLQPPSITKSFSPTTIETSGSSANTVSTITFTISNGNTVAINSSFTDTLPSGIGAGPGSLVVAATPAVVNNCGGTVTANAGSGSISFANPTLAVGTCTVKVNVQSAVDNVYNNSVTIDSTDAGIGNTATATPALTVLIPPNITKTFSPVTIPFGATTSLTFTVNSPNLNETLNAIGFTDTLPAGLIVANPNNLTSTCTGAASAASGGPSASLTGASLAPGASCKVSLTVQATAVGVQNNSVTVSDTAAGVGNTSSASVAVSKADTTTTVTSSVNPSVFGQSVTFTATVSPVAPGAGTPTGTVTFLDGGNSIGSAPLSGGVATFTISALVVGNHTITTGYAGDTNFNGSTGSLTGNPQVVNKTDTTTAVTSSQNPSLVGQPVTFTATVSAVAPGAGTPTGTVTFLDGGTSIGTATLNSGQAAFTTSALALGNHTITTSYGGDGNFNGSSGSLAGNPQVVSKANTTTTLTSSQNSSALGQAVTFTATVSPAGTPTGTVTFLDGVTPIGTATLSGGFAAFTTSVLAAGNHTVTASYSGDANFNGSTGLLIGNPQVVVAPPLIAKGFNPGGIQPNGVSTLTITITNPAANTVALQGVAFTDSFPANVVVATPNGLTNTCGGTATAAAGSGTVSLSGGTVAVSGSCTVTANVTSSPTGSYLNTTGPVSSTNGGTGSTASATLSVANAPTISKLFLPTTTFQNGTSLLSFTITNPNSNSAPPNNDMTLTGISFTDNLPAGLVVASPNQLSSDCGGTVTAVPGSALISLTGGTVAPAAPLINRRRGTTPLGPFVASGSCFISVKVQATTLGTLNNTTGPISANESGPGAASNTASLTVTAAPAAPTLAKAFAGLTIPANTPSALTFAVTNPNGATPLNNIAFNDTLPSGLVVANPNGLADVTGACSANVMANPGSNSISLTNQVLAASGSCTFAVNVIGASPGVKNNVTSVITAAFDDGTGTFIPITGGTASASTTVLVPDLTIAKSHSGNFTQGDVGDTYQITVGNAGNAPTSGTVTVTDSLPAFLIPTAMGGTGWTCTLGTLSCTRSDVLAGGSSYPPITLTVSVAVNAPPSLTNSATVSGGGEINTANDTAIDTTTINQLPGPPLTITLMVPSTQTIESGNSASFVFDVVSHSATLGNINFACSGLPSGAACSFNPPNENQGEDQVTMTVITTANTSSAVPFGMGKTGPLYAALLFPVVGLLSLAAAGRKNKKSRLRLVMFLGGLLALMALFGCGGTPHNGTPTGAHTITVTATSAANPTITASTQVVVTVQ